MEPRVGGLEGYEERRVGGLEAYEAPKLRVIGPVAELTRDCKKELGGADGFIFQGTHLVCTSP